MQNHLAQSVEWNIFCGFLVGCLELQLKIDFKDGLKYVQAKKTIHIDNTKKHKLYSVHILPGSDYMIWAWLWPNGHFTNTVVPNYG